MITVLFSGGLDSTVLAHKAHALGLLHSLLFYSYGQPAAAEELAAALYVSNKLGVDLISTPLTVAGLDNMRAPAGIGPRVVHGRNATLLALAANYAAAHGIETVWYGATLDDKHYRDCTPKFLALASSLFKYDTGVNIEAPLIYLAKAAVLDIAYQLCVDLDRVWYCYNGTNGDACGVCNSCILHPIKTKVAN